MKGKMSGFWFGLYTDIRNRLDRNPLIGWIVLGIVFVSVLKIVGL